jgi:hypothetical protein
MPANPVFEMAIEREPGKDASLINNFAKSDAEFQSGDNTYRLGRYI